MGMGIFILICKNVVNTLEIVALMSQTQINYNFLDLIFLYEPCIFIGIQLIHYDKT
jgi:hypothetical protein